MQRLPSPAVPLQWAVLRASRRLKAIPPTRIGVDTGGTFTDCAVLDGSEVRILKVFSTADDAARGIARGVRLLTETKPGARRAIEIIHGTTVGTNTLLERQGARVALVTTEGFEDLIEIGRQARPRLYDLNVQREPPLVPGALRFGVKERTAADGSIVQRPARGELGRLRNRIRRSGAESVAVCFLFSFRRPANERAAAQALRELGLPVSVSHQILPEFREYERLSATVTNAYLVPRLGAYLAGLKRAVSDGVSPSPESRRPIPEVRIFVMQSSGGITTAARAAREPVRTILSGPAGGVVAARRMADQLGVERAISFDMGGTSTDVCLFVGAPRTTNETTLGGLPVAVPVLDIHSVGAGGGSVARIDAGGALRVGPESAGATPGPVCYGRGGAQPTVTDANLILGRLDPEHFLGGTFRLDLEAARASFVEFLRRQTRATPGLRTPLDLARGIIAVSSATMERALRVVSVERGHDPRDFALICFGGAGGLHAAELAQSLGLPQVVVPRDPGAFSALGILLSDIITDVSQSVLLRVPDGPPASFSERAGESGGRRSAGSAAILAARARPPEIGKAGGRDARAPGLEFVRSLELRFQRLEESARAELRREHFRPQSLREATAERRLDVRYAGQAYELSVPFTADFPERFHREHERAYGHSSPGRALEIVNLRVRLLIPTPKPGPLLARRGQQRPRASVAVAPAAIVKCKSLWFQDRAWTTPFYDRERLRPGTRFRGPAVVVEYGSTTVVPPDWTCSVGECLNLVLRPL